MGETSQLFLLDLNKQQLRVGKFRRFNINENKLAIVPILVTFKETYIKSIPSEQSRNRERFDRFATIQMDGQSFMIRFQTRNYRRLIIGSFDREI